MALSRHPMHAIPVSAILILLLSVTQAFAAPANLEASRDTLDGVALDTWDAGNPAAWTPERFVRLRNRGANAITLDSLTHPDLPNAPGMPDTPLPWTYAVRTYPLHIDTVSPWPPGKAWKPVTLAPGDSVDIGLFQIGEILVLVKQSAGGRSVLEAGDSVTAPFAVHAGSDSSSFVLRTVVATRFEGPGAIRRGMICASPVRSGFPAVRIDGRVLEGIGAEDRSHGVFLR